MLGNKKEQIIYQYQNSRTFFPNNVRSHWLLQGHMTYNNETVSRHNLWAGKIEKSITSEGNSASLATSYEVFIDLSHPIACLESVRMLQK